MNALDILLEIRAIVDGFYPWKAFVGLVALHPIEYADKDALYALDPLAACRPDAEPWWRDFAADLGQTVLLHPDAVPVARQAMMESELLQRLPTDAELAAWLFWGIRTMAMKGDDGSR